MEVVMNWRSVVAKDAAFAKKIAEAVVEAIADSPCRQTLETLPDHAISIMLTRSPKESLALVNSIAPEHLQIMTRGYKNDVKQITNAAAIFLGPS